MAFYSVIKERNIANVSTNRIFKLAPRDGNDMVPSKGRSTFNMNMFKGDKQLHGIQDNGLWHLEYRTSTNQGAGLLPEPLKQKWTNFNQMMKFLTAYFEYRNIEVKEVIA